MFPQKGNQGVLEEISMNSLRMFDLINSVAVRFCLLQS